MSQAVLHPSITLQQYTLPTLPYDYNALEPVISAKIMELHHGKHHKAYVDNLNAAINQLPEALQNQEIDKITSLLSAINFNGGGHINHSIFWENLSPQNQKGGIDPKGPLANAINKEFGSLQNLKDQLSAKTIAIQGSGWGWLGFDPSLKRLTLATCANQNALQAHEKFVPLLGIDVWEHAYYIDYQNRRADYVKAIWSIVNWENVAKRYEEQIKTA